MMKIICLVFCLISAFGGSSTSTNISCVYNIGGYHAVGSIYRCVVNNDPNIITEESTDISEVIGTHQKSKSNNYVLGFHVEGKIIQIFPKGLNKFFKNLRLIFIQACKLEEIHQTDVKVFPNLVYFYLHTNAIEVIEEGLFDFNPNLEFIGLWESKIVHIDPNVFDNLNKLNCIWFGAVRCVPQNIEYSRPKVLEAIKVVKSKCTSSEFLSFDNQIKSLEIESKAIISEAFHTKFEIFENNLEISIFFKFRPLNYKFQNLKSAINSTQNNQVQNVSILDVNDVISCNSLKNITDKSDDQKSSQCELKCPVNDVSSSKNEPQTTLSEINSLVTEHGFKLDEISKIQDTLTDHGSKIDQVQTTLTLSSISTLGSTLDDLKASHDQMSKTLTDLKTDLDTKLDEKLEIFEENLINSEGIRNGRKIEEMRKELDVVRYKISLSIDSKLKMVENRLMEKIDEKLNKILKGLNIEN